MIFRAPSWAQSLTDRLLCADQTQCVLPPDDQQLSAWRSFARAVTQRFPQARAIEVWNEPNRRGAWSTLSGPDPARYVRVLRAAYQGVKAANPSMPVLIGGIADSAQTVVGQTIADAEWLQNLYYRGARGAYDGIGVHPYPEQYAPDARGRGYQVGLGRLRSIRLAHNDPAHFWITEWGYFTRGSDGMHSPVTETQQAVWTRCAYQLTLAMTDVDAFLVYNTRDVGNDAFDAEHNYGVFRFDGSPKEVVAAMSGLMAAGLQQPVSSCPPA
jgi:hypothetical protein